MKNVNEIRFVATNYFNLQGLRMVPIGILGILVALWVNGAKYPISMQNYLILLAIVVISLVLYFGIDRYYLHSFGKVKNTAESRHLEGLVSIVGGVLALAAFWVDVSYKLPLCVIGLVFGVGLLEDYIRITWLVKGRHLLYYPIGAVLAIIVSLLPLLGLPEWWHEVGLKSQLEGILIFISLFSIFAGLWGHIFLVRTLAPKTEEK